MKPIFLIGFTAVGKTTIGKRLASRLGLNFLDADEYLEKKYHSSIGGMMAGCGIEKFRKREKVILIEISQLQDTVIATGGGMPTWDDNIDLMLARGTVIYLEASVAALTKRLIEVRDSRPTVMGLDDEGIRKHVENVLPKRIPIYERAHFSVSAETLVTEDDEIALTEEIATIILSNK
ncbi:shikimate kinase [Porphyromonadaceae bacterium W3.11]|nr:shikimate kinase [Porphyromonadaceae bacterium W3.11]